MAAIEYEHHRFPNQFLLTYYIIEDYQENNQTNYNSIIRQNLLIVGRIIYSLCCRPTHFKHFISTNSYFGIHGHGFLYATNVLLTFIGPKQLQAADIIAG